MANVKISALPTYTGSPADLRWFVMNNSGETETYKFSGYTSPFRKADGFNSTISTYYNPNVVPNKLDMILGGTGNTMASTSSYTDGLGNSIVGGANNVMDLNSPAGGQHYGHSIFGGNNNTLRWRANASVNTIVGGQGNVMDCYYGGNSIIGGSSNTSQGSANNTIIGAQSSTITGGDRNGIWGGYSHSVGGDYDNNVYGGFDHTISAGGFNSIVGGNTNTINGGINNSIIGGANNTNSSTRGVVVGGNGNTAGGTSNMVGGENNNASGYVTFAYGTNNTNNAEVAFIGGGASCNAQGQTIGIIGAEQATTIGATNVMKQSFIGGGFQNNITTSLRASVIAGQVNTITSSADSSILAGTGNTIDNSSVSQILGGQSNTINCETPSVERFNTIINGSGNTIFDAADDQTLQTIINSVDTTLQNGTQRVTVIGLSGRTINDAIAGLTYVENLKAFRQVSEGYYDNGTVASGVGGYTINWNNGAKQSITITGSVNTVLYFTGNIPGGKCVLKVTNTSTGGIQWADTSPWRWKLPATTPSNQPTASATDIFVFESFDDQELWLTTHSENLS